MKQPFTTLWPYAMKNDYPETQDNEEDTERSRKLSVPRVSRETKIERESQREENVCSFIFPNSFPMRNLLFS